MTSILLGSLVNSKNNLKTIYSSNISGQMNVMQQNLAKQNFNNSEYLKQFDDLRFDSVSDPVGVNEAFTTTNGLNTSLQRNLDFNNGYSNFQQSDMHYDVVTKEHFTHNNMVPHTSKRDFSFDMNSANKVQRKLETFTGIDPNYVSKKEKTPLFEPLPNLTWVNGMPVVADKLVTRYLPSNKNNYGNVPFQTNVRVRPGVGLQNQEGNYGVYRVNPRNVDALRSEINQKVSYENKPLETIKKGEYRGPDPNLTKHKLPDFRVVNFGDLLPSKADINAPKQTGDYTNVITQRNEKEIYYTGHSVDTNKGSGPDKNKTKFEPAKKESYISDPTHSVVAVNNKPVMTNTSSYTNYETQRVSTNSNYKGAMSNVVVGGNYTVDYKNIPLVTSRELMIHGDTNIGVSGVQNQGNYIFSNDMVLPTTHRESTSHTIVGNVRQEDKSVPMYNNDSAKPTIRQTVNQTMIGNVRQEDKSVPMYNNDIAKSTIRQTVNQTMVGNVRQEDKSVPMYNNDSAKPTIRQTSTFTTPEINIKSYVSDVYVNLNDEAKPTIKQTTLISKRPTGNVSNALANYTRDVVDEAKPTIRQTTENNQYVGQINSQNIESGYARDINNKAKPTIRQSTENNQYNGHINSQYVECGYARDINDKAKSTIRQTTENNQYVGHVNSQNIECGYTKDINDKARPTIKQTTLYSSPAGRMNNSNMGNYSRDITDEARPTIKQTTLLQDYTGGLHGEVDAQISHMAANNMEIDDRREILTYNRPANGKGDDYGPYIDRNNVRMNDRRELYNYVSHPHKSLDMSVMPTTSNDTIKNVYMMSKPVIEQSAYYVNQYFINTLKDNPYVNDIYHQKNV
jgi:hypothetical protein